MFYAKASATSLAVLLTAAPMWAKLSGPDISKLANQCSMGKEGACHKLAKIALTNRDASIRCASVANISDQELLRKIAAQDQDAAVRDCTQKRITLRSAEEAAAIDVVKLLYPQSWTASGYLGTPSTTHHQELVSITETALVIHQYGTKIVATGPFRPSDNAGTVYAPARIEDYTVNKTLTFADVREINIGLSLDLSHSTVVAILGRPRGILFDLAVDNPRAVRLRSALLALCPNAKK